MYFLAGSFLPLAAYAPVPSGRGGAYRYGISANKLLKDQRSIGFGYIQAADNFDRKEERTRRDQNWQANLTGKIASDFSWQVSYQGGSREVYSRTNQHLIKLGLTRSINETDWNGALSFMLNQGVINTRQYQWKIGYTQPVLKNGFRSTAFLQWTHEEKTQNAENSMVEGRVSMEKNFRQELAKSYLVIAYQNKKEKSSSGGNNQCQTINFEGNLTLKIGATNFLIFYGKISLWSKNRGFSDRQTDYSFNLNWRTQIF